MTRSLGITNPRTGVIDYSIAPLDATELARLAGAARSVQPLWASRSIEARGAILLRLADAIARHQSAIIDALVADTGRAAISAIEVAGLIALIRRWSNGAADLIAGASPVDAPTAHATVTATTRLIPYPLVGIISPWNFPLTLAMIDAVPALMAGCAVLIKPSEVTPRFIRPLMQAVSDVPELAGILTLVEGDGGTGAALVPLADYVAFTGSVATGRKVAAAAAQAMIPASLELGGKDPMIILASADPRKAAEIALRASIVNTGQACQSIERVYVHRAIADPFIDALVAAANAVELNWPDINRGHIGPFIFARQAQIVQAQIDEAVAGGARLLCGGQVENLGGGLYLRPTVLTDVAPDMQVMSEETFGPVIPVTIYDDIDDAVAQANAGHYGLSGAVVGGDIPEAKAVGARLHVGAVSINDGSLTSMVWEAEKSSFGASGIGPTRMGASGLLRFFRRQALLIQHGAAAPIAAYAEQGAG